MKCSWISPGNDESFSIAGNSPRLAPLKLYLACHTIVNRKQRQGQFLGASLVLNAWIADRIGPPVLQSSLLISGWVSEPEASTSISILRIIMQRNLGMWQEKDGQWGLTKDKIQEDQITMTIPNTGKWNRRREVESSNQNPKSEKDRLRMLD